MSEAPERIWMDPDIKFPECDKQYGSDVEYVRADRIEELEAKLAKSVELAEKSIKWLRLYGADVHREAATLAELTGGKDDTDR